MDSLRVTPQQKQSSVQFLRSTYARSISSFSSISGQQILINTQQLIQSCQKNSLQIIRIPDKRLQNGLSLISFKINKKAKPQQHIIIFMTKYDQENITIVGYYMNKQIEKVVIKNQMEISNLLKKWLDNINNGKSIVNKNNKKEIDYKKGQKLIQQLNKRCSQLLKSQKSQMFAIQKLKTTKQYHQLIQYQIQLNTTIQQTCSIVSQWTQNIQKSNLQLLPQILHIQQLKNQIQQLQYSYQQLKKKNTNVKEYINQFIENQRDKVQKMSVQTQEELNQYINQMKKLKKMENQKRFMVG